MDKLRPEEYEKAALLIDSPVCGGVFAHAVAEHIQPGDVYIGSGSTLFWHCCGFALICGDCGESFLRDIYDTFLSGKAALPRRFLLFDRDGRMTRLVSGDPGISAERRLFFEFPEGRGAGTFPLPDGFELRRITKDLLGAINGRVTPPFYWNGEDAFLSRAAGFCVTKDGAPAAWAFGAGESLDEIDIGVETAEEFRGLGLASTAANAMIEYALSAGKRPTWACHSENPASRRLALRLGFEQTAECGTIKRI